MGLRVEEPSTSAKVFLRRRRRRNSMCKCPEAEGAEGTTSEDHRRPMYLESEGLEREREWREAEHAGPG